mmetsp:Transcript_31709/g.67544  ORF Transcript_31709/g.67544 Transcript_31709/m.67544 type:complete len:223 (-) Transcript_31709:1095-1763(-)
MESSWSWLGMESSWLESSSSWLVGAGVAEEGGDDVVTGVAGEGIMGGTELLWSGTESSWSWLKLSLSWMGPRWSPQSGRVQSHHRCGRGRCVSGRRLEIPLSSTGKKNTSKVRAKDGATSSWHGQLRVADGFPAGVGATAAWLGGNFGPARSEPELKRTHHGANVFEHRSGSSWSWVRQQRTARSRAACRCLPCPCWSQRQPRHFHCAVNVNFRALMDSERS